VLNLTEGENSHDKLKSHDYSSQHFKQHSRQKLVWVPHSTLKPKRKTIKPIPRTWNLGAHFRWNFWRDTMDSIRTTGQESTINDLLHLLHPANINLSVTISKHD